MSVSELNVFITHNNAMCFLLLINLSELDSRCSHELCELVLVYNNICLLVFYFKNAVDI